MMKVNEDAVRYRDTQVASLKKLRVELQEKIETMTIEADRNHREIRDLHDARSSGETASLDEHRKGHGQAYGDHQAMKKDYDNTVAGLKESMETLEIQAKIHFESLTHCQNLIARLQQENSQLMQERNQEVEEAGMLRDRLDQYDEDFEKLRSQRAIRDIDEADADDEEEDADELEDDEFHDVSGNSAERTVTGKDVLPNGSEILPIMHVPLDDSKKASMEQTRHPHPRDAEDHKRPVAPQTNIGPSGGPITRWTDRRKNDNQAERADLYHIDTARKTHQSSIILIGSSR